MSQIDDNTRGSLPERRFRLDRQRAVMGGVCAGMANYVGWDVALVRIAWVLATIFFFGSLLIVYPIIWAIAD